MSASISIAPPREQVVGVADCKFSNNRNGILTTYALGSCLGITFYDKNNYVAALLHIMLAQSKGDTAKKPYMYLDEAVPLTLQKLKEAGANLSSLEIKVFGGAKVMQADSYFSIGSKNIEAFKEMSAKSKFRVPVWEVGGQFNRTIKLHLENGMVKVRTPGKPEFWL
ncbi:MAG: chemotaxis protein CheD [Verrucomicrobiota bacterium]